MWDSASRLSAMADQYDEAPAFCGIKEGQGRSAEKVTSRPVQTWLAMKVQF
jgi:hypothetical protein